MKKQLLGYAVLFSGLLIGTTACSSDDEESSTDESYIQFYNASANSTSLSLSLDDYQYTAVEYANAMPKYAYVTGEVELEITGEDEIGEDLVKYQETLNLNYGEHHLFMLVGDYHSPEFLDVSYLTTEMDELNDDEDVDYSKMQVLVAHTAMDAGAYDVYIGVDGREFIDATLLDSLSYKGSTLGVTLDTGDYVIYLTGTGSLEPVYTTASLSLTAETVYKLIIRDSFGPGTPNITIDNVDSTSGADNHANIDAAAEFRLFNGLKEQGTVEVLVTNNGNDIAIKDIELGQSTEFQLVDFDDYGVTIIQVESQAVLANNLLVTFNQDETKSMLLYQDADEKIKGLTLLHDLRPRAYESEVSFANLAHEYDDLNIYFVSQSETIESAEYYIEGIDFTEIKSLDLATGDYEVSVVYEDDNGDLTLLYQSENFGFEASQYTLVLYADDTQPLGFKLAIH
ncbi:DUF4397 domain-containing protein [Shewanella psychropiezotolerans]|uniref:DUF4397 domain-containing protein n=1 Tax=Shewanella psychropiezotolerans TaxID=2593655 RepID=A0ABX5WTY3_9GAMM|nr:MULTISPECIES: DUF4397 domain-containing protein [Shewanella]MPY25098.1 DUF4397 domain-containing protein [Shewanella sp. YLB-07]QDO82338.1 DUF4397 domain-containing protein [Shewanella psychropiezotolerans]